MLQHAVSLYCLYYTVSLYYQYWQWIVLEDKVSFQFTSLEERKRQQNPLDGSVQHESLLFSTERSQLRRFKHLLGITMSYLVMQSFFIGITAKMAAGKASIYRLNCMFKIIFGAHAGEKWLHYHVPKYPSDQLIFIIDTLLYIYLLLILSAT